MGLYIRKQSIILYKIKTIYIPVGRIAHKIQEMFKKFQNYNFSTLFQLLKYFQPYVFKIIIFVFKKRIKMNNFQNKILSFTKSVGSFETQIMKNIKMFEKKIKIYYYDKTY